LRRDSRHPEHRPDRRGSFATTVGTPRRCAPDPVLPATVPTEDWPHCRGRRCSADDIRNERATHRSGYRSGRRSGLSDSQAINCTVKSWHRDHVLDVHSRPPGGRIRTTNRATDGYALHSRQVRAVVIGWSRIASAGFSPSASARVIRARGNCLGNGLLSAGWSSKHGCVPPAHGIDGPKRYGVHPGRQVAPMAVFYPAGSSDTSEHEPLPGPRSHPVSDCSSIGKQSCPEPPRLGP